MMNQIFPVTASPAPHYASTSLGGLIEGRPSRLLDDHVHGLAVQCAGQSAEMPHGTS